MDTKPSYKPRGNKVVFQVWIEKELHAAFKALIGQYDPDLDFAPGVTKLIRHAVKENWIPGYIRKERVLHNKLSHALENLGKESS